MSGCASHAHRATRRGSRADVGWERIRTCRLSISHRGLFDKGGGCSVMEAAGGERTILPLGGGAREMFPDLSASRDSARAPPPPSRWSPPPVRGGAPPPNRNAHG